MSIYSLTPEEQTLFESLKDVVIDPSEYTTTYRNDGAYNAFFGRKHTEESKELMRDAAKHRPPVTEETRAKISAGLRARPPHSPETRAKLSAINSGEKNPMWGKPKIHSEDALARISAARKGVPQMRHTCPHCGKVGGNAMLRWHFDKCKSLA